MKSQAIPIPEKFTLEWYTKQKQLKRTEESIAREFYISVMTLRNWKKKIGWHFHNKRPNAGRKPTVDIEEIIDLVENEGFNYETTANIVGLSSSVVRKRYKQYALVD